MRTIPCISFFLLLLFQAHGQGKNPELVIRTLAKDCYIYTTYKDIDGYRFPSNSMYVVTENGIVMIDTPWDETQFQPLLDSIASKHKKEVVLCIATHFHDDRTAGLEFLKQKGIPTYTSELSNRLGKKNREKEAAFHFAKDTTFVVGKRKFETFYPGEGHTKDNIVIWIDDQKILYGGCLVKSTENKSLGNIADANLNDWAVTIKKVMKKFPAPEFVIPGHFGWSDKKSLKHTLKLLRQYKKSSTE